MAEPDIDLALRTSAFKRARELQRLYDDVVPLQVLREGFEHDGSRVSFGSFQRGIHRPRQLRGPAALAVVTAPPAPGKKAPYEDLIDERAGAVIYSYRDGPIDQPDNRALRAAFAEQVPLIYFQGVAPSQYAVLAPVYVTSDDPNARCVLMEPGLPVADTGPAGLTSPPDVRRYALGEFKIRLHQHQFHRDVMRAYRRRCTICALKRPELIQAAHIVGDATPLGIAAVVNGLALCAIHHLAYDRNLLGVDPGGVVHIARPLLDEIDGPMLREGLQGFHGRPIAQPRRESDRPDPERLALRFAEFENVA